MPIGKVKFFDIDKGFGFIAPDDGREDIFVHVTALQDSGLSGLGEGDVVEFDVERHPRSGRYSATKLDLLEPGPRPNAPRGPAGQGDHAGRSASAAREGVSRGVVKWFNDAKGFGFIAPDSGGEDIFVHISEVQRAGLSALQEGEAVVFHPRRDPRTGKLSAGQISKP